MTRFNRYDYEEAKDCLFLAGDVYVSRKAEVVLKGDRECLNKVIKAHQEFKEGMKEEKSLDAKFFIDNMEKGRPMSSTFQIDDEFLFVLTSMMERSTFVYEINEYVELAKTRKLSDEWIQCVRFSMPKSVYIPEEMGNMFDDINELACLLDDDNFRDIASDVMCCRWEYTAEEQKKANSEALENGEGYIVGHHFLYEHEVAYILTPDRKRLFITEKGAEKAVIKHIDKLYAKGDIESELDFDINCIDVSSSIPENFKEKYKQDIDERIKKAMQGNYGTISHSEYLRNRVSLGDSRQGVGTKLIKAVFRIGSDFKDLIFLFCHNKKRCTIMTREDYEFYLEGSTLKQKEGVSSPLPSPSMLM